MSSLKHVSILRTKNDIIWLSIDSKDNEHNALTPSLLHELNEVISSIKGNGFNGLVISSAKPADFIIGTDLDILLNLNTEQKAEVYTSLGNELCENIKQLDCTTVALINGHCRNSGLEIAFCCDYRVSHDNTQLQFAYNDIQQGHYSGFGGISHLITAYGLSTAIEVITQPHYSASEALNIGLIDYIVPLHKTHKVAEYLISQVKKNTAEKPTARKHWKHFSLSPRPLKARAVLKKYTQTTINKGTKIAINTIIETWKIFNTNSDARHHEATCATQLLISEETQRHLALCKRYQQLDQDIPSINSATLSVHIIGCGIMGRYLVRRCAEQGFLVSIYDSRHSALEKLLPELHRYFKQHYSDIPNKQHAILDRIVIDIDNAGLIHADLIIEATPEDKYAKASLLRDIDQQSQPNAILLTTTACLPLAEISKEMKTPQRLAAFNPYHPLFISPIAEISVPEGNQNLATIRAFVSRLKFKPIQVKSNAGYLGTRLLMTYLTEAMLIHQTGVSLQAIDKQTQSMGMSHAPFDLIDSIGISECLEVSEALADRLGFDMPSILMQKNEQGLKGKSTGSGFYRYKKGEQQHPLFDKTLNAPSWKTKSQAVEKRLIEKIVNEARVCLQEELVSDQEIIDLIAIIVIGFPPEKGGPLHYLKQLRPIKIHVDANNE
ncbi:MAG: enoyl-CoA hydratase/isomerase family protein [Cocleimonas sp.]|nr:enoyl-CoA hydratase/isomerase family protein [Cocleimonas sp.]